MRDLSRTILIPICALAMVVLAIVAFPQAVQAAWGKGTHGSFSPDRRECSTRDCAYYGTWTADPPSLAVVRDVLMDEFPRDLALGAHVPAVYLGETDPAVVYPNDGSMEWFFILLTAAGFSVVAVAGVMAVVRERRADRRSANYQARRALEET